VASDPTLANGCDAEAVEAGAGAVQATQ